MRPPSSKPYEKRTRGGLIDNDSQRQGQGGQGAGNYGAFSISGSTKNLRNQFTDRTFFFSESEVFLDIHDGSGRIGLTRDNSHKMHGIEQELDTI